MLPDQERPAEEDLETYLSYASEVWAGLLQGMEPYQKAISDPKEIPGMRKDTEITALLFKPAAQIALVDSLLRAVDNGSLKVAEAIERANRIPNWSMKASLWEGVCIKESGAIDAGKEARRRMASLLCYLIACDRIDEELKFETWRIFNEARRKDVDTWLKSSGTNGAMEDLPVPVEGRSFTVNDAKAYAAQADEFSAV